MAEGQEGALPKIAQPPPMCNRSRKYNNPSSGRPHLKVIHINLATGGEDQQEAGHINLATGGEDKKCWA